MQITCFIGGSVVGKSTGGKWVHDTQGFRGHNWGIGEGQGV